MAKYVQLDTDPDHAWRLPENADIKQVETQLVNAMRSGDVVSVMIDTGTGTTATLHVDGKKLLAVSVHEVPPPPVEI